MLNFDHLYTLSFLFEDAEEKKEYEDLHNDFHSLKTKVLSKQEITEGDDKEFFRILQIQRRRIIADKCNELKEKIEKRNIKGQHYSINIREIDKIRKDEEKDFPIDKYDELLLELSYVEKEIDEKISIEKYQIRQSRKMLIIGIIVGFILSMKIIY